MNILYGLHVLAGSPEIHLHARCSARDTYLVKIQGIVPFVKQDHFRDLCLRGFRRRTYSRRAAERYDKRNNYHRYNSYTEFPLHYSSPLFIHFVPVCAFLRSPQIELYTRRPFAALAAGAPPKPIGMASESTITAMIVSIYQRFILPHSFCL